MIWGRNYYAINNELLLALVVVILGCAAAQIFTASDSQILEIDDAYRE